MYKVYKRITENVSEKQLIREFMDGHCIPFTVALKEIFPNYKIGIITGNYDFLHAFCFVNEGLKDSSIIVDAEGKKNLGNLEKSFWEYDDIRHPSVPSAKDLIKTYAGKELDNGNFTEPFDKEMYETALSLIRNNLSKYEI